MTTTPTPQPASVRAADRRLTPDLARGFMLLLIAMAYAPMHLEHADVGGYGQRPGGGTADQVMSFLATLFLENRAFPLFGIMFGAGLVMLVTRQRAGGAADTDVRRLLRRRSLWLLVFGFVHATLVFPGEILAAYGVGGLVLAWLLFRGAKALRVTTIVLCAYYGIVVTLGGAAMIIGAQAQSGRSSGLPGYTSLYDWIERLIAAPFTPLLNTLFFPLFLLVVIGIWFGRKGLFDDPAAHRPLLRRLAVSGVAVSVLGGLPLALNGAGAIDVGTIGHGLLFSLQILTGVIGGIGYAATFALVGARLQDRPGPVARTLAAAGQRSLSVYLFASVGVAVLLHPALLNLGAHVHRAGAMAVAFAVWLVGVLIAGWLAAANKPGPADALLRRLIYRRRGTGR